MELSNLKPQSGSVTSKKKRLGRGQGSGKGGTATRGHKGAKSRSGYSKKLGFEGGQMPLQRRIPKFGFKNINRVEYKPVNLTKLQELIDSKKVKKGIINAESLISNGLVKKNDLVKILGNGDLKDELKLKLISFQNLHRKKLKNQEEKLK